MVKTKKLTAFLIAILIPILCVIPVLAQQNESAVFTFRSDIAGMTAEDVEKFIFCDSSDYVFEDAIVSDCVGNYYTKAFKPGRTYDIFVTFVPVDGVTVPGDESKVTVNCEKGAQAYPAIAHGGEYAGKACIMFYCSIRAQGNIFQRIIGAVADLFTKAVHWSPY